MPDIIRAYMSISQKNLLYLLNFLTKIYLIRTPLRIWFSCGFWYEEYEKISAILQKGCWHPQNHPPPKWGQILKFGENFFWPHYPVIQTISNKFGHQKFFTKASSCQDINDLKFFLRMRKTKKIFAQSKNFKSLISCQDDVFVKNL